VQRLECFTECLEVAEQQLASFVVAKDCSLQVQVLEQASKSLVKAYPMGFSLQIIDSIASQKRVLSSFRQVTIDYSCYLKVKVPIITGSSVTRCSMD